MEARYLGLGEELPEELWGEIGKRLSSRLDVAYFRSVCRTWRSCLPPPTRFPLRVPLPPGASESEFHNVPYFITEDTYYRMEADADAQGEGEADLMVLSEVHQGGGKLHSRGFVQGIFADTLVLSHPNLGFPPIPEISRLSFLCKVHALKIGIPYHPKSTDVVRKLVLISPHATAVDPRYSPVCDLTAVVVLQTGKLAVLRLGSSLLANWDWEVISFPYTFADIIRYKAELYAVDQLGRVWVMDYHSLKMTQVSALPSSDSVMRFVESSGQLYLFVIKPNSQPPDLKIYKLRSQQWVQLEARDLGDQVFFLHRDEAFSLPRHVFDGTDLLNLGCRWVHLDGPPVLCNPVAEKVGAFPFRSHTLVFSNPVEDSHETQVLLVTATLKPCVKRRLSIN